jgi:hypothetical protein
LRPARSENSHAISITPNKRPLTLTGAGATIRSMDVSELQEMCERGQALLMETRYWEAEHTLAAAEEQAWTARDWDTLARLYMPLQEARRQRRQRCGEGVVCLDLLAEGPADEVTPAHVLANYPHGQLLVAGWGTIRPALAVRQLASARGLYVETFLAAAYPIGAARAVVIAPTEDVALPPADRPWSIDELLTKLPPHSIVLSENELPRGSRKGDTQTYAEVMAMWERLAAPFLAAADMTVDPVARIEAYRRTIRVDYACELAHQKLSDIAKDLDRQRREARAPASKP